MIRQTFIHLTGIGATIERRLWELGVRDWEDALKELPDEIGAKTRHNIHNELPESETALAAGNARFFCQRLAAKHHWRIYPTFADRAAFLDIETTGLDRHHDQITTAAIFDGTRIHTYVRGRNLDDLPRDLQQYELIVSYNGRYFDVPFIEAQYPGAHFNQAHIDLRNVLGALGYRGGLKGCERQLGITRPVGLIDVDGFMAVRLWWAHLRNDPRALPALLRYNVEDTVNLRWLMETAYNLCAHSLPIPVEPLAITGRPAIDMPFDSSIIDELR